MTADVEMKEVQTLSNSVVPAAAPSTLQRPNDHILFEPPQFVDSFSIY